MHLKGKAAIHGLMAGLMLSACRHPPVAAEPTGDSAFAFVDRPASPPPKVEGESSNRRIARSTGKHSCASRRPCRFIPPGR